MKSFITSIMYKWVLTIFVIVLLVFSISCFFLKSEPLREMKSKFESGVDQSDHSNSPFYMHFFYIGILFLVFDAEVVISIPMIQSMMYLKSWLIFWTLFVLIIFIGLIMEMSIDSIEWKE